MLWDTHMSVAVQIYGLSSGQIRKYCAHHNSNYSFTIIINKTFLQYNIMDTETIYLDDYSKEDIINDIIFSEGKNVNKPEMIKPNIMLKTDYNKKGQKVAVFTLIIPVHENTLTIDILINDELYKKIGNFL